MGTGRAELDTTTAGVVATVVDGHVRSLPNSVQTSAGELSVEVAVVRGWTVTGGTAAEALRVATEVRQMLPDGTEAADDAESYAQLRGVGDVLRSAGFVVEEVLDGWRTVAVDVARATAGAEEPSDDAKPVKPVKAKKVKKVKVPKPPKAAKQAKARGTKPGGVPASGEAADRSGGDAATVVDVADTAAGGTAEVSTARGAEATEAGVVEAGESSATAATPKKSRGGLLRRRSAPRSAELVDESETAEEAAGRTDDADAGKDLELVAAA